MPLEINEIGIRMRVRDSDPEAEREPVRRGAAGGDADPCADLDREAIVEDCVRRVLKILENLPER